ncbi:MAG: GNAT family N-acetyltransferase [Acidimicrobiia bacterium]
MTAVRPATAADLRGHGGMVPALVRSFDDDPLMGYLFPDAASRPRRLRLFFAAEARRALHRGAVVTTAGPRPSRGGAIWAAPGRASSGAEPFAQFRLMRALSSAMPRVVALMSRVERAQPGEPHWYLVVIGADPGHQRQGVGSALLRPVLERCDHEGTPAFLVSSKASNIPFYGAHGFELRDELQVPEGPTVWPMWRDPQPKQPR